MRFPLLSFILLLHVGLFAQDTLKPYQQPRLNHDYGNTKAPFSAKRLTLENPSGDSLWLNKKLGKYSELEELMFYGNDADYDFLQWPDGLFALKKLRVFTATSLYIDHWDARFAQLKNIGQLNISATHLPDVPQELSQWPHLKSLVVSKIYEGNALNMPRLDSLQYLYSYNELPKMLNNCPNLQHLECTSVNGTQLDSGLSHLSHLRVARLRTQQNANNVLTALSRLPALEDLTLEIQYAPVDYHILLSGYPALRRLHLPGMWDGMDAQMLPLFKRLDYLAVNLPGGPGRKSLIRFLGSAHIPELSLGGFFVGDCAALQGFQKLHFVLDPVTLRKYADSLAQVSAKLYLEMHTWPSDSSFIPDAVARMKNLHGLNISAMDMNRPFSETELNALRHCDSLQVFTISDAQVESLEPALKKMKNLKKIVLVQGDLSMSEGDQAYTYQFFDEALQCLRTALPEVTIVYFRKSIWDERWTEF